MKKNFVIIGLGRFGACVAKQLVDMNCEVLAIDSKSEAVTTVSKYVSHAVIADATKLDVLKELGVDACDHAVVAIGKNLEASILTVANLKKLGINHITVRIDAHEHYELFDLLGATEILLPEEAAATDLANQIYSDAILEYHVVADDYVMVKIVVGNDFSEKSIIDLDIRNKYAVNIVGMIRNDQFFIPMGTDLIKPSDIVVVAGKKAQIRKFTTVLHK